MTTSSCVSAGIGPTVRPDWWKPMKFGYLIIPEISNKKTSHTIKQCGFCDLALTWMDQCGSLSKKQNKQQQDYSEQKRKHMLVGGFNPSEKYESIGVIISNIWENKTCSKPPSSISCHVVLWNQASLFGTLCALSAASERSGWCQRQIKVPPGRPLDFHVESRSTLR